MKSSTLGILGGLGPAAGIYFCKLITDHTKATCDQEHVNFLLSSRADTPDRTAFILGKSNADPAPVMAEEAKKLVAAGADCLVIPCNTAHYFYDAVAAATGATVLHIIEETVGFCKACGIKRVGVLATEGTVKSGAYEKVCHCLGVGYDTCTPEEQASVSHIIYGQIKKGQAPDADALRSIGNAMKERGCEALILGCTELSLLKRDTNLGSEYVDSMEVLAAATICHCGKEPIGFDPLLMKYYSTKGNNPCC